MASPEPLVPLHRAAQWHRALAATAGFATGYFLLAFSTYASIRWGDTVAWLDADGTAGFVVGSATLAVPLIGAWLGWRFSALTKSSVWALLLLVALAAVFLIPRTIDCGDSITGFTCSGTSDFRL